jgi:hypothetical protein
MLGLEHAMPQHAGRWFAVLPVWKLMPASVVSPHLLLLYCFRRRRFPLPKAPRLLTAEEERVLGSIIQQHRKLKQLYAAHPDIAAAAFSDAPSSTSSSSKPDRRHRWPPALTPADVAEVTQLPQAWRSLLPTLATQAAELLVTFNLG